MKVLLLNGSPNSNGCTFTALKEIEKSLNADGIETTLLHIGKDHISGCTGCRFCIQNNRCIFDDIVNQVWSMVDQYDGFIFGSPVHFAGLSGGMTSFMDRLFYINMTEHRLSYKPAAGIISCRRAGSTAALDQINKYFTICNMPIVSSQYWNMVHGTRPEEVLQDAEGMQTMKVLGKNMSWLLKVIELGKKNNLNHPNIEPKIRTNFIR